MNLRNTCTPVTPQADIEANKHIHYGFICSNDYTEAWALSDILASNRHISPVNLLQLCLLNTYHTPNEINFCTSHNSTISPQKSEAAV